MVVNKYTPDSQLRRPSKLIKLMLQDLFASRELAFRLMIRNIRAQYRQTFLGYLWLLLPPILSTTTFVFLNKQKILNIDIPDVPYAVYVFSGMILWQAFVDVLLMPIKVVSNSKSMLAKVNFHREALILAGFGEVVFNFSIRIVLLFIVFYVYSFNLPATFLFAPIGWISILFLGLMIGVFLTPLGILYQDVERGLIMLISLWFFVTPIIYNPPAEWPASILVICNPVSPLIIFTRELMLFGSISSFFGFILVNVITVVMLLFAWILYRISMPHLIARMSS